MRVQMPPASHVQALYAVTEFRLILEFLKGLQACTRRSRCCPPDVINAGPKHLPPGPFATPQGTSRLILMHSLRKYSEGEVTADSDLRRHEGKCGMCCAGYAIFSLCPTAQGSPVWHTGLGKGMAKMHLELGEGCPRPWLA